ncbi:MAG TPA: response regulator [Candidatus Dormibacteraeota bacterium]|jgi:two-component system NtrC family response regulator/two-component system nitrogen regulation response regulator GlnG|nr:response regulator [Candidatus Dormibacteraeota bacterium]
MAKILVAEDHADLLRMICLVLESSGHEVTAAFDGVEATRLVRDGLRPDLFLSDFRMPGTTGLDTVMEIRSLHPTLPCLIVTGDEGLWRSAESLAMLDIEVVRKPFAVPALVAAVNRALATQVTITGRVQEHPTSGHRVESSGTD